MIRIFISHTWSENAAYERFVAILDEVLGTENWTDVSIPESKKIHLGLAHLSPDERRVAALKIALAKADALLADPNLPDVIKRIVYRGGQGVEVPSRGSVLSDRARIVTELEDAAYEAAVRAGTLGPEHDPKGSYRSMISHPELAFSIETSLRSAGIAFVLITPFLNYREWVNYEIAVCARLAIPAIGVRMGDAVTPNYRVDCHRVIECDRDHVRAAVEDVTRDRPETIR